MQQISPPLRIALAAIVLLGAVWFVALRPKDTAEEPAAVTAPGVEGLANGVASAREAKEAAESANARTEAAVAGADGSSTASATKSGSGTATAKAQAVDLGISTAAVRGPSLRLVRALADGKAVVLLFRNKSADSAHVTRVVQGVFKRDGRVVAQVANVQDVADYSVFTNKTPVSQAPTTFIIGPSRRAQVIAGYTSTGEIDQAIGDVLGKRSGQDKFGNGRGRDRNG